jgi:hypothetical protein
MFDLSLRCLSSNAMSNQIWSRMSGPALQVCTNSRLFKLKLLPPLSPPPSPFLPPAYISPAPRPQIAKRQLHPIRPLVCPFHFSVGELQWSAEGVTGLGDFDLILASDCLNPIYGLESIKVLAHAHITRTHAYYIHVQTHTRILHAHTCTHTHIHTHTYTHI